MKGVSRLYFSQTLRNFLILTITFIQHILEKFINWYNEIEKSRMGSDLN